MIEFQPKNMMHGLRVSLQGSSYRFRDAILHKKIAIDPKQIDSFFRKDSFVIMTYRHGHFHNCILMAPEECFSGTLPQSPGLPPNVSSLAKNIFKSFPVILITNPIVMTVGMAFVWLLFVRPVFGNIFGEAFLTSIPSYKTHPESTQKVVHSLLQFWGVIFPMIIFPYLFSFMSYFNIFRVRDAQVLQSNRIASVIWLVAALNLTHVLIEKSNSHWNLLSQMTATNLDKDKIAKFVYEREEMKRNPAQSFEKQESRK